MPKYLVTLPIAGSMTMVIEAANEEVAITAALDQGVDTDDIEELQSYRTLIEGNVCHAACTEAEAEEIDDEEGDSND